MALTVPASTLAGGVFTEPYYGPGNVPVHAVSTALDQAPHQCLMPELDGPGGACFAIPAGSVRVVFRADDNLGRDVFGFIQFFRPGGSGFQSTFCEERAMFVGSSYAYMRVVPQVALHTCAGLGVGDRFVSPVTTGTITAAFE